MPDIAQSEYESLAELRHQLRRFLHFSEQAAHSVGLEPQQHQLMLALKGLPSSTRPRVGELAERLQIRHHSAVELVNRLVAGGYVRRAASGCDRREVLLSLTAKGEAVLHELSVHHQSELRLRGPALVAGLKRVMRASKSSKNAAKPAARKARGGRQDGRRRKP